MMQKKNTNRPRNALSNAGMVHLMIRDDALRTSFPQSAASLPALSL